MNARTVKPPATYEMQLQKLIDRGCVVDDTEAAMSVLKDVNYYRFTAYFLPFRDNENKYVSGTNFNTVNRIYEFDRELSGLLFNAIMTVELKLRANIAYYHAHRYGALGYEDENNFVKRLNHRFFMKRISDDIKRNDKLLFVKHHNKEYGGKFPLWAIIELFSFGELSKFYSNMKTIDQKAIANLYNANYKNFSSWLMCVTYLRNYCAHNTRLYYNHFAATPATPKEFPYTLRQKVFDYILVLKFLYSADNNRFTSFVTRLEALIEEYKGSITLEHIGFPENWLDLLKHTGT